MTSFKMSASMKTLGASSSSDSEDDEALKKIREAAVDLSGIINGSQIERAIPESKGKSGKKKASLRPSVTDQADEDNVLKTTPGFRKHVAEKLSQIIESEMDIINPAYRNGSENEESLKTGVKLFAGSSTFVSADEEINRPRQRKRKPSSSDDSEEDERLKEAAVSHDFIIGQSKVRVTDKSQDDVTITHQENENSQEVERRSLNSDCSEGTFRKKKKKKKKHKAVTEKEKVS